MRAEHPGSSQGYRFVSKYPQSTAYIPGHCARCEALLSLFQGAGSLVGIS